MAKNNTSLIFIVIGLLLVGYFLYTSGTFGGIGGGDGIGERKNRIECSVEVTNPVLSDRFYIGSNSCSIVGECNFLGFSQVLSVANTATIHLVSGGKVLDSDKVELGDYIGRSGTVTLSACADKSITTTTIEVRNSAGILTDSKLVNF